MKKYILLISFPVLFFSLFLYQSNLNGVSRTKKKPKNVIFVIADGMGPASFVATRVYFKGSQGALTMESLPYTGYAKTYSGSGFVTDSAASGTALASGVKTYNGAIGMSYNKIDPKNKSRSLETIVDVMKRAGKSTGVLSTTRVTHATPAAYYAHVPKRSMEDEIASFVKDSSLDLLMGGGRRHFVSRKDGVNLLDEIVESGWVVLENKEQMRAHTQKSVHSKVLGLFNQSHITYEKERRLTSIDTEPSLTEMTKYALDFLNDNEKGFFLMLEAGRIDHASHENDIVNMLHETKTLDECIEMILEHEAMKDTLLIITADHETAGLAVSGYGDVNTVKGDELLKIKSQGTDKEFSYITWASGPNSRNNPNYPHKDPSLHHMAPSAQYTEEANHSAVDVQVMSTGVGASSFVGFMNNTEIPRKILALMGLDYKNPSNKENPRK